MKLRLIQVIKDLIDLLDLCGLENQVDWLRSRLQKIKDAEDSIPALKPYAKELRAIIAGMGSFTDLSLEPKAGTGMSEQEANRRKWELADNLDEITGKIVTSIHAS